MIRRTFLQAALAILAAPLSLVRSKPDNTFGGTLSSKDKDKQYSAPVFLHLTDGSVMEARAFGNQMSYRQPIRKHNFIGDKRTYYEALGTEIQFDYLDVGAIDGVALSNLLYQHAIDRVIVPFIEFPTSCVAIDHEHASGKVHMAPGEGISQARTKMELSMTVKKPMMSYGTVTREHHLVRLHNVLFSNVKG